MDIETYFTITICAVCIRSQVSLKNKTTLFQISQNCKCSILMVQGSFHYYFFILLQPLFMDLSFQAVHTPLQAPQEYIDLYEEIEDEERRIHAGNLQKDACCIIFVLMVPGTIFLSFKDDKKFIYSQTVNKNMNDIDSRVYFQDHQNW